jgi:hypothetical protein
MFDGATMSGEETLEIPTVHDTLESSALRKGDDIYELAGDIMSRSEHVSNR